MSGSIAAASEVPASRRLSIAGIAGRLLLAGIWVLLAAGCGRVTFGSTFRSDGSATHTLDVIFDRTAMIDVDARRLELAIDAAEERAREDGFEPQRVDTPRELGLRLSTSTDDALDVAAALNSLFNSLGVQGNEGPLAPFQGTFRRESEAVGGTEFDLTLTVDGDLLFEAIRGVGPGNRQLTTPEGVREVISVEYVATMPGEIKETNGSPSGDSTVRWDIPLQGVTDIAAESTVGKESPWGWIVVTIVAAFAVVAVVAAGMAELLLRRRRAGVSRLPLALHVSDADAAEIGIPPAAAPRSLSEVGASLRRVVERIIHGERVMVQPAPDDVQPDGEERADGAEPERG